MKSTTNFLDILLKTKEGNVKATIKVKLTADGRVLTPDQRPMSSDSTFDIPVDITEDGEYYIDGLTVIVKDALKGTGNSYLRHKANGTFAYVQKNIFTTTTGVFFKEKEYFYLDTKNDELIPVRRNRDTAYLWEL
jgi:hypothetical protein